MSRPKSTGQKRRASRLAAVQALYEVDLAGHPASMVIDTYAQNGYLAMLDEGQVTRDRRPLVGVDTVGIDALAEVYPRDHSTRPLSSVVETLASRGDDLVLVRWSATSGSGREWDALHLSRWNADGRNELNVIFPVDQLDEALAELESLASSSEEGSD